MEQQQCPICMLYLLPGMNLQDHLDTHPKDMIIKALLSAKTEPPKPTPSNETTATVFLSASAPYNPSQQSHIYHDQQQQQLQQQQQHQQQQQNHHQNNNFALAKRSATNNNNNNNGTVLFNNRPYRLTLDAPQTVTTPTSNTTFLNPNSSYGSRTTNDGGDLFDNKSAAGSFRCIQNTEQKNIMIVNTSSTQFIQQTLPVKKPTTAIELHPVIIDNSGMPINTNTVPNAISIFPRYTSEKYSGPPPSYSTAISSVTNTLNDKPRVIDLTQTPTISTMKHCGGSVNNNNSNNNKKMTTLSSNGAEENRHLMIRGPQILECTQNENGDYMITEKLMPSHQQQQQQQPSTSSHQALTVSHEEEVIAEGGPGTSASKYSIKFVDVDNQMTFITDDDGDGKFHHQEDEQQFVIEESMADDQDDDDMMEEDCKIVEESENEVQYTSSPAKSNNNGVKVLSNVKLTSSEMFSPSIKDIIKQYNNQTETKKKQQQQQQKKEEQIAVEPEVVEKLTDEAQTKNAQYSLIHCTETLNLSKDKDESSSTCTTSVIRKTALDVESSSSSKKDEPQPSTSGCASKSNLMFKLNPSNRLKINRQPKKLVVKLKKPLIDAGECSAVAPEAEPKAEIAIKNEVFSESAVIVDEGEKLEAMCKVENINDRFDTTFLDHHDYGHVNTIVVTPELHHDSETNQSCMSMDLEPENHSVKREQDDFPVVIKTEMLACSTSSSAATSTSSSQSSCSNSSPGPSRLTIESVASTNENSQLNFLYQNDRVRFSPPLSPYVYMKTYSSTQGEDQPKQEADISWNESNSLALQNSDHNSTSSRYTPSFDDRSNYTDIDGGNNKTNMSAADGHIRAPSTDSLNIRTDEKMPARGEISEQESNGEIEQPWHHPVRRHSLKGGDRFELC